MDNIIITEKNIEKYKDLLGSSKAISQVQVIVEDFTQSGSVGDAYAFLNKVKEPLRNVNLPPDAKQKYSRFILLLEFTAFPLLENEEQHELLSQHILFAFKNNIDLRDRIHLVFFPYFDSSQASKLNLFLNAFENNSEALGGLTIGKWIQDYNKSKKQDVGGTLTVIDYLTKSQVVHSLDHQISELLKNILLVFDWLRYQALPKEFLVSGFTTSQKALGSTRTRPVASQPVTFKTPPPRLATISPPKQPIFTSQTPAPELKKEPTEFEKKLAEVSTSAPVGHGADLEAIKQRMEQAQAKKSIPPTTLSASTRPSSLGGPVKLASPASTVSLTPDEIKREVATRELPPGTRTIQTERGQTRTLPPRPQQPAGPKMSLPSLSAISVVDDLKKVEIGHLRQGPVLDQIQTIKAKIKGLSQANNTLPYYVVLAFEQSPLFKSYLQVGSLLVHDQSNDRVIAFRNAVAQVGSNLTLQEFEAVADLRKEIERL